MVRFACLLESCSAWRAVFLSPAAAKLAMALSFAAAYQVKYVEATSDCGLFWPGAWF